MSDTMLCTLVGNTMVPVILPDGSIVEPKGRGEADATLAKGGWERAGCITYVRRPWETATVLPYDSNGAVVIVFTRTDEDLPPVR